MSYWMRLALLLAAAVALFGQPAGTGVIAGSVVSHRSGDPVRKAIVFIEWQGSPKAWGTVQTDSSGRFTFDSLPPGQYAVRADKRGVGAGSFGSDIAGALGRYLVLAAGESRTDILIKLVESAAISGRIVDADGDPMPRAEVQLLREGYPRGVRELTPRNSAQTDDRGQYRFANVGPGKLYIAARLQNAGIPGPSDNLTYPTTYYGGALDWRRATPIMAHSGEQIANADVIVRPTRMIPLRGRVTGIPTQPASGNPLDPPPPARGLMVQVVEDDAQSRMSFGAGVSPGDGSFEVQQVPPGRYVLSASMNEGDAALYAMQKIDLTNDPGEITLALAPPVAIKGKLVMEGEAAAPMDRMVVELLPARAAGRQTVPLQATPGRDGTFVFPKVPPGTWDIGVRPIPNGGFIKSMRLGTQDVLTEEMEITSRTTSPLNLVVSSRGGKVSGKVGEDQSKAAMIGVVLAPSAKFEHVMSFYRADRVRPDGTFDMSGLTPGQYRLYAIEMQNLPLDIRNPEILGKLADLSETIEIKEGGSVTVSPKVIPAARFQEALQ